MSWSKSKWLIAGFVCIVMGYVLLATTKSLTAAPLLLVAGYCVLIPAHLWSRYRHGAGE